MQKGVEVVCTMNPLGEIGLSHSQGSYSSTKIKNKLNEPVTIRMKVYDGALAS